MTGARMRGRWRVHAVWSLLVCLTGAGAWWAATTIATPPVESSDGVAVAPTYTVGPGEVGQTTSAQASLTFLAGPQAVAGRDGTVTTMPVVSGGSVDVGTVLATIDLRPVVVARGDVPAFRAMSAGHSGPDVAQLRAFLGLPEGDRFDAATTTAVERWQRELGIAATGVVELGDMVFLPVLPVRATPAEGVEVGTRVAAGDAVVTTVLERPALTVAADGSGSRLSPSLGVTFTVGDGSYAGTLGATTMSNGMSVFPILDGDGASPCDATCAASFPVVGTSSLAVSVEEIPAVSGLVVPVAALGSTPEGTQAVRSRAGEEIPVDVLAQAGGMAVVTGVDEGTVIQLFGDGS